MSTTAPWLLILRPLTSGSVLTLLGLANSYQTDRFLAGESRDPRLDIEGRDRANGLSPTSAAATKNLESRSMKPGKRQVVAGDGDDSAARLALLSSLLTSSSPTVLCKSPSVTVWTARLLEAMPWRLESGSSLGSKLNSLLFSRLFNHWDL
jgi:hypothetical protein